jgi:hypothetical protein
MRRQSHGQRQQAMFSMPTRLISPEMSVTYREWRFDAGYLVTVYIQYKTLNCYINFMLSVK